MFACRSRMQQIQQRPSRRQLCHSTRSSFLFTTLMFILIGLDRHGEGTEVGTNNGCPVTQFRCSTTARCVNLNVFCDGRNDCGDNSDEPAQCTREYCVIFYYKKGINESINPIPRQIALLSETRDRVTKMQQRPLLPDNNLLITAKSEPFRSIGKVSISKLCSFTKNIIYCGPRIERAEPDFRTFHYD